MDVSALLEESDEGLARTIAADRTFSRELLQAFPETTAELGFSLFGKEWFDRNASQIWRELRRYSPDLATIQEMTNVLAIHAIAKALLEYVALPEVPTLAATAFAVMLLRHLRSGGRSE